MEKKKELESAWYLVDLSCPNRLRLSLIKRKCYLFVVIEKGNT